MIRLLLFCLLAISLRAAAPNFIFILLDDYGWADSGCYGSQFHVTPNIDRLAREGMRFTCAYAAAPVCSPTRASILTGKYPARLQLTDWLPGRRNMPSQRMLGPSIRQELPLEEITIAEALKRAGYISGHIGKWHLGGFGFGPESQGFDLNIAGDHTGTPLSYLAPFRRGKQTMPRLDESTPGEYLTDRLTAEAVRFIEANHNRPFFLYLPHYAVHTPLQAKQDLIAKHERRAVPGSTQSNAVYAAMIESVDAGIGRILDAVDRLELADRTVVIFTSDNGGLTVREGDRTPATSNEPFRSGKGFLFEGGIRVPLIVRWRGNIKPGTTDVPISSVDFFPTMLELAGVQTGSSLDGISLVQFLKGSAELPSRDLFWHYPHYSNQGGRPGGAVRSEAFKLIEHFDNERVSLYNLRNDPSEECDLANQLPREAHALRQKLKRWREGVGAQMMLANPDYRPTPEQLRAQAVLPGSDGTLLLHARDVTIQGTTVRYEPQTNKNTIGYWTRVEDSVSWDFYISVPGIYTVQILQGCGKGSGGSEVEFFANNQSLRLTVQDTGHFQNFVERELGSFEFSQPGRYTLHVKPRTKPGVAVMDLRQVVLRPYAK